ncbi:MAG TPA: ABC transporter permease [Vicinamibacterales bacterium]|nr:ABC transporter permease [Vicinamibacterales bacterium]
MLTRIMARLRALALRRRIAGEIDEELNDHLAREVDANIARGMDAADARRRALADLGGLAQTREETNAVRDGGFAVVRQALSVRALRRQPLYVASCVVTLALAVAAATTMGAVIKPALLDPLPYRADGELVMINTTTSSGLGGVNVHTLNDLRAAAPPLGQIAASRAIASSLTQADGVYPLNTHTVEANYFATLGVVPARGRVWSANETNVAVATWPFWQRRLQGDEAAIGRSITIDGVSHVVIGVLPRGFVVPWNPNAEVLLPINLTPLLADPYRARRMVAVVARRSDGVPLADVSAHLAAFSSRMATAHPDVPGGQTLIATPLRERMIGSSRPVMLGTAAATALLLLIVASNIAGLAAVRAIALRRQTAVKTALGASRGRIVAERLGESLAIALAGTLAGVGLSTLLIPTLRGYQAQFLFTLPPIALTPALAFAGLLAGLVVGTMAGVLPHLTMKQRGDEDPLRASRGNAGDRSGSRLRMGLAALQTALALVLVIGAGLLGRTLTHLAATPLGFDPSRLTSFFVNLPGQRYARQSAQIQFEQEMLARLERIPGIEAVTSSIGIPVDGGMGAGLYIEGRSEAGTPIHYMSVAPNFRELFGLSMLAGREIDTSDVIGSPRTLVINETMAKTYWPEGNAVGARIFVGVAPSQNWMTVVGIVADVRQHGPGAEVMPTAFGSTRQYSWPRRQFVFRTAAGRTVPAADLRAALRDIDPALAITTLSTLDGLVRSQQATQRLVLFVLGSFAVLAAVLCAFGLYSVLALTSSLRRREYAIRLALGSTAERVRWLVVRQALVLATIGVATGIGLAWMTTRSLSGLLEGIQPTDPLTFAVSSAAIVGVALLASWLPARRAATVNGAEVFSTDSGS